MHPFGINWYPRISLPFIVSRHTTVDEPVYVAWSKSGFQQTISLPKGRYWVMDTAQVVVSKPIQHNQIPVTETPVYILKAAPQSPCYSIHLPGWNAH